MKFFTQDTVDFFSELEKNNKREWFNENKTRYENSVKIPFEEFVQHMIYKIQEVDEDLIITPKEAIFRIYRDIRFSKDKTPYKTHASAVIGKGGRKNISHPSIYFEVYSGGFNFYSGIYQMDTKQIYKVRSYISANLKEFEKLLNWEDFKKYFGKIHGEQNKVLPAEFKEVAKIQPLLANKQFYYFTKLSQNKLLSKTLPDNFMKFYFAAQPMNKFLINALS